MRCRDGSRRLIMCPISRSWRRANLNGAELSERVSRVEKEETERCLMVSVTAPLQDSPHGAFGRAEAQ